MRKLFTHIDIDAPAETVWSILTDTDAYGSWNTFMPTVDGQIVAGETLVVRINPPGGRAMTFKPRVIMVEPGRRFAWLGHALVPGLFDGEHHFEVEPENSTRCRLTQFEEFSGMLVPLMWRAMSGPTAAGFEHMNAEVKARAEAIHRGD